MKKFYSLLICFFFVAFSTQADVIITIDTPGTLEELLFEQEQEEYEEIAVLKIIGAINADDLGVIRAMSAEYALRTLDLSDSHLPDNKLESLAFNKENCALEHIVLPKTLESFTDDGGTPFHQNILSVKIPTTNLKLIPEHAFTWCVNITELEIPEGVTRIGKECFVFCTSLSKITLPSTLTRLDESAFLGDVGFTEGHPIPLKEVIIKATTPPELGPTAFLIDGYWEICTLQVPVGSVDLYKADLHNDGWYGFGRIQNIKEISPISINDESASTLKIYSSARNTIIVEGAQLGDVVSVYNISGVLVKSSTIGSNTELFELSDTGIYIVRVGSHTSKVIL